MIILRKNIGRITINLNAIYIGADLIIILSGGDKEHLGAISYGGVNDKVGTIKFKNHMDDVISDMFSKEIEKVFNGNYAICAGIHLDNITKEEISQIKKLSRVLIEELILIIEGE